MNKTLFLAGFLFLTTTVSSAEAMNATVGGGAMTVISEYRGVSGQTYPMPMISWENERFYVKGLGAGVHLYKNGPYRLSVGLCYLPMHFDPKDSNDARMRRLDRRYSSLLGTAGWAFTSEDWGTLHANVSADILDESNGFMADIAYSKAFSCGPFALTPKVGLLWTSDDYNEYYYGVSHSEARRSGLSAYDAEDGFSPYAGLRLDLFVTPHIAVYATASAMLLCDEVRDSPMVNEDVKYSFGGGLLYKF